MKPSEVLTKARELLSDPARWTQGSFARDASGMPALCAKDAVSWCLEGALDRVGGRSTSYPTPSGCLYRVVGRISMFNDNPYTTHARVLSALDRAIKLAVSEGQ